MAKTTVLIVCIETEDLNATWRVLEEAVDASTLDFYTLTKDGKPHRLPGHRPDLSQLAEDVAEAQGFGSFTNDEMEF